MGILKKLVVTATGACGPSGKDHSHLKKWVEANGGKWVSKVQKGVTHVICDKEGWKGGVDAVQQARKIGIWVVSYDWLEDSLMSKRKLAERKYTWEVIRKERRKRKEYKRLGVRADAAKFKKGCEKAREDTGSGKSISFSDSVPRKQPSRSGGFCQWALNDLKRRREERAQKESEQEVNDDANASVLSSSQVIDSTIEGDQEKAGASVQDQTSKESNVEPTSTTLTPTKPSPQQSLPTLPQSAISPQPEAKPKLTDLYHIYLDNTGFEYDITLVRSNLFLNNHARYNLRIYESNTKPHVYCTFARYQPPAGQISSTAIFGRAETAGMAANGRVVDQKSPEQSSMGEDSVKEFTSSEGENAGNAVQKEMARLQSLITKPVPSDTQPYRSLICPMNSTFENAFRTFRTAFQDLTLLSWEERFDNLPPGVPTSSSSINPRPLQKSRARELDIEPFVYVKPKQGLPIGLMPALPLSSGTASTDLSSSTDARLRNTFGLPGINVPLSREHTIGASLHREAEERKKREEEARIRAEQKLSNGKLGVIGGGSNGAKKATKPNWNKPLFNGVSGRPSTDVWGGYVRYGQEGGGRAGGGGRGAIGGMLGKS